MEERRLSSQLTPKELCRVELVFLRQCQSRFFLEEIDCLKNGRELPRRSKAYFLDSDGLLQVGGMLRGMDIKLNQKHPVILHRKDPLASLLARHVHQQNMHVGPTGLMV